MVKYYGNAFRIYIYVCVYVCVCVVAAGPNQILTIRRFAYLRNLQTIRIYVHAQQR